MKAQLAEGEFLFAFLDDVYIVARPVRIRFLCDLLGSKLHEGAGIQLLEGKTRTWNRGGLCPDGMQQFGPDVWSPAASRFWGPLWDLRKLLQGCRKSDCEGARSAMCVANPHPMRETSLPPLLADHTAESVRRICPRSRRRTTEARLFDRVVAVEIGWSRVEVRGANVHRSILVFMGRVARSCTHAGSPRFRGQTYLGTVEARRWQHGWQYHASSSSEHHFRETVIFATSCAADQHSGPGAGDAMLGCPTGFEFQLQPELFRTLVLERLRLPLNITDETCACGAALDTMGRHRAAWVRSVLWLASAAHPSDSRGSLCK